MERQVDRWGPHLVGLGLAVPFWLVRYPPMGDLAFHEAAVAMLRHLGDPRFLPPGLYETNVGEANQLFHLLAYLLAWVVPTPAACTIVVGLTVYGTTVGALALARHLGVTPWGATLVAPIALGWMARWGLVANLLGFAILLGALPRLDAATRGPSPRRALVACGLVALLFFAHESAMGLALVAVLVSLPGTARRPRDLALAVAPVLLGVALAVAYHVRSAGLKAPSVLASTSIDVGLARRVTDLPASLYSVGGSSGAILLATVLAFALLSTRDRSGPGVGRIPLRFVAFGALSASLYFAMPEALSGSTLIYQRFLAPGVAVLLLALLPSGAPRRWYFPAAALVGVGMLAATSRSFAASDRSARDLDRVLDRMVDGEATAQLDLTPRVPSLVAPVPGEAARALAVHGGRLLFSFTDAPTYPLTVPARLRWDEPVARMALTPYAFAPAYDLTRFRYVLVRCASARVREVLPAAFAPEARLVVTQGHWLLFESTLPRVSVTAKDGALPTPAPTPLAARVQALLGAAPAPAP